MKLRAVIFLAVVLPAAVLRADQNNIQALVGDAIVTRGQILSLTAIGEESIIERTRGNTGVAQSNIMVIRQQAFDSLINYQLVLQEFKNLEKKGVKIPDSVIDGIVRREVGDDRIQFAKELQRNGKTLEQFREEKRNKIIYESMVSQFVTEAIVSPHQIETYYKEHLNDFKIPERVKLRLIFLKKDSKDTNSAEQSRALALEVSSLIKKDGASFKDIAKTYSELPASASDESPDWVNTSSQKQQIQDAVARLKPGESSDVIDTPEGYFIALLEARDPEHIPALNDAENSPRNGIERQLKGQERQRRIEAWIKRLESRIFIQRF